MSRWIGRDHIEDVLSAADAWRERCFLADGSLFSEAHLWTLNNIRELKQRLLANPIKDANRPFFDKLKEQLDGVPAEVTQLAAEAIWFLLLFPIFSATAPDTKRGQIKDVWKWSGADFPDSTYLSNRALMGVGRPGTAYATRRPQQLEFLLEVLYQWKALPEAQKNELMTGNTPWSFVTWLDEFEFADRRPVRNAILYFLFPDDLERNMSNNHRRQIVGALKHRLPVEFKPEDRNPSLFDLDRAIAELRKGFEREFGTTELDFYLSPIYNQWFMKPREDARDQISTEIKEILAKYDLEIRQCGSKKKSLEACKPVSENMGFWENPTDATNKPLRWFLHLELENDKLIARVPKEHGSRRLAYANTAQGTSGAVTTRIVPVIKINENEFVFYEVWEWMFLHCFFPALPRGSSGQLFEKFDEKTGQLIYMGKDQPYIAAGLITLNDGNSLFDAPGLPRSFKYSEATEAISTLINVSATATRPSEFETEKGGSDGN